MTHISVIVPLLEAGDLAESTLESIAAQTDAEVECLIVAPERPARALAGGTRWIEAPDASLTRSLNVGWANATGEFVGWLAPGECYYSQALARVVDFVDRHPKTDVCYGDGNVLDEAGDLLTPFNGRRWRNRRRLLELFVCPSALFVRRAVGLAIGPFDAGEEPAAAFGHWIRLVSSGARFEHLPALLVATRRGRDELEGDPRSIAAMLEVLRGIGRVPSVTWSLAYGRASAGAQGLRADATDFDRVVLRAALGVLRRANGSPASRYRRARLVIHHLRREVQRAVEHPEHPAPLYAKRASRAIRAVRRAGGAKLFRFATRSPVPMRIPEHYARARCPGDPPTIAIVTPSFNQARFLERTMRSILDQDYPRLEYVVRDGGSTDGSVEIVERHRARLHAFTSLRDAGQGAAINLGFAETSGEIMAWLNSDDLLLPGSLATVARIFRARPDVDVVYGHRILIDEHDREISRWVLPAHDDRLLSWIDYVPQESLFWRRSLWERVGGRLDESFAFAVDWDLLLRMRDAGARFLRVPRFLGAFRISAEQKSTRLLHSVGRLEMERLRMRVLGYLPDQTELRRVALPYVGRHWLLHRWEALRLLGAHQNSSQPGQTSGPPWLPARSARNVDGSSNTGGQ